MLFGLNNEGMLATGNANHKKTFLVPMHGGQVMAIRSGAYKSLKRPLETALAVLAIKAHFISRLLLSLQGFQLLSFSRICHIIGRHTGKMHQIFVSSLLLLHRYVTADYGS